MRPSYYELLQMHLDSPQDKVLPSYRWARQVVTHDPDRERRLEAIEEAYQTLKDPEKRREYDEQLESGTAPLAAANGIPLVSADGPLGNGARGCDVCGAGPTADVLVVRCTGLVLAFFYKFSKKGKTRYCREHGLEVVQQANRWNLVFGWLGVLAIPANVVALIANARARAIYDRLPSPPTSTRSPAAG